MSICMREKVEFNNGTPRWSGIVLWVCIVECRYHGDGFL